MAILSTLATVAPYHVILYSLVFGSTAYQSFYAGIVAFKALPHDKFSALQARIFPGYFTFQTAASAALLASLSFMPLAGAATAAYVSLGTATVGGLINVTTMMPITKEIMARRVKQQEIEGKHFKDPSASDEMKKINKEFGKSHGISILLNLAAFGGLLAYGVIMTDGFLIKNIPK
ncbi:hypothetical protein NADFUDRAFT_47677 [Nadsonia fulvescens var. elongata DSM 6958]|uniref:TMEM205-like domain-containing protein n=1 Tax=Nadsonia fulvescens var. elongata DSM 6958 TaxID=857566 RepID=A0A1E3PEQ1_9ASCO|nr:hypothetical protein NADFUDRAFT_47677 [Nadsonia fulvescens var. elongata DSM 6958]